MVDRVDEACFIVMRARTLVSTGFRLHGRDPATGLDCVGLVASAAGVTHGVPTGYALRGGRAQHFISLIDTFASRRTGRPRRGDVLMIVAGPAQYHLGIWTGHSFIHAHAGLRRVVETPGAPEGEIVAAWHITKEIE